MPTRFDLPSLSDKDYASLQLELTAAIPQYSRNWTDFNYSDPGIALLQLLCWLGDMTLYRVDTVPRALYLNFLRWVVGASGTKLAGLIDKLAQDYARDAAGKAIVSLGSPIVMDPDRLALAQYLAALEAGAPFELAELRAKVATYWQAPYRLVTADDFAVIAQSVTANIADLEPDDAIGRVVVQVDTPWVHVMPVLDIPWEWQVDTNVSEPTDPSPVALATLVAYIAPYLLKSAERNYGRVLPAVRAYLEPRRLLGTPIVVEKPVLTPLAMHIQFACLANRDPTSVATRCYEAIQALLSPFTGGPEGTGWPYDRPVLGYDVEAVVLGVDGVDRTQPVHVALETITGLIVGRASLGVKYVGLRPYFAGPATYLGRPGQIGLPQLWQIIIDALDRSYGPMQIGVRSTIGLDTRLPLLEV